MTAEAETARADSPAPVRLDRATMRARLAAALGDANSWSEVTGDVAASQRIAREGNIEKPSRPLPRIAAMIPPLSGTVEAAVLVPLIEREEGYSVLLTQRNADLTKHAGQVAFPGGRMDSEDVDAEACALREAWEETRLDPAQVEILGRLRPWITGTGYHITPVVGALTPPLDLRPHPREVAAVFEVPLAFFLDPANHRRVSVERDGVTRYFYEMPYGDRYIWGATAGMLVALYYALRS